MEVVKYPGLKTTGSEHGPAFISAFCADTYKFMHADAHNKTYNGLFSRFQHKLYSTVHLDLSRPFCNVKNTHIICCQDGLLYPAMGTRLLQKLCLLSLKSISAHLLNSNWHPPWEDVLVHGWAHSFRKLAIDTLYLQTRASVAGGVIYVAYICRIRHFPMLLLGFCAAWRSFWGGEEECPVSLDRARLALSVDIQHLSSPQSWWPPGSPKSQLVHWEKPFHTCTHVHTHTHMHLSPTVCVIDSHKTRSVVGIEMLLVRRINSRFIDPPPSKATLSLSTNILWQSHAQRPMRETETAGSSSEVGMGRPLLLQWISKDNLAADQQPMASGKHHFIAQQ